MTSGDKKAFGRRINAVRKERRLTSDALSEKCGIDPVYVRMIERGARTPSLSVFLKLCNSLRVSPSYLLADCLEIDYEEQLGDIYTRIRELEPTRAEVVTTMIEAALDKLEQK